MSVNRTGRCDGTCDSCDCPVESIIYRACHGEGTTSTGIGEWSRTICNKCDGTGYSADATAQENQ